MMDTNKIGSGATIDELLAKAKEELGEAERHYAAYEKIPQDPRQDPQAAERLKHQYDVLYGALSELIQLLGEGKINAFFDQPTQSYQDNFEQSYNVYLEQNGKLYQIAVDGSNSSYNSAIWTLIVILVVVLAVIVLVWTGIHHILVRPLNRMIEHIKQIAAGDLTQQIVVNSRNEIQRKHRLTDVFPFAQRADLGRPELLHRPQAQHVESAHGHVVDETGAVQALNFLVDLGKNFTHRLASVTPCC